MALTNCSINQGSIVVGASAAIGSTSNIVLTITPNAGYVLSESDFTIASPPTGISTITKANTATAYAPNNTVSITCDLDDNFVVGTSDVTLTIDVDGAAILAQEKPISVSGTFTYSGTNTAVTSETGSYTNSGFEGETEVVLTKTFTASSGYYFTSDPTVTISAGSYNSNYSVSNGSRVYDSDNNLTAVTVTISYTYPSVDQTGHTISLVAAAVQIPTVTRLITNASTITNSFSGGTTRPLTVTSTTTDSNYAITITRTSDNFTYDFTTDTFTSASTSDTGSIGSTGVLQKDIIYPSASSGDTYNISVAGDGTTTLTTQNVDTDNTPFTLQLSQVAPISLTIDAETTSTDLSFAYTNCGPHSLNPNSDYTNPNTGNSDLTKTISIVATAPSGRNLHLIDTTPEFPANFDNTDSTTNGGLNFDIDNLTLTGNGTTSITLGGNVNVYLTAASSVVSSFLADNMINKPPTSNVVNISVNKGGSQAFSFSSTDPESQSLTHSIVANPGVGSLSGLSNTGGTYTHNNSNTLIDSFTYKANDGFEDGNTATVNVAVGVSPGASISTSGNAGIYLVPIVLGTDAGTFKAHFDAITVPDRFQILFDTAGTSNDIADMEVVADSLYVGGGTLANGTTQNLNEYTYNGSSFDTTGTANQTIIVSDAVVCEPNTARSVNPSDVSSSTLGSSRPDSNGNATGGSQLGVQSGVFTSATDTSLNSGLDKDDGNICLYYTKPSTTAFRGYLRVYGHPTSSTTWHLYKTEFSEQFGLGFSPLGGTGTCSSTAHEDEYLAYVQDNSWTSGKLVYTDSTMNNLLAAGTYKFYDGTYGFVATINSSGAITTKFNCTP